MLEERLSERLFLPILFSAAKLMRRLPTGALPGGLLKGSPDRHLTALDLLVKVGPFIGNPPGAFHTGAGGAQLLGGLGGGGAGVIACVLLGMSYPAPMLLPSLSLPLLRPFLLVVEK